MFTFLKNSPVILKRLHGSVFRLKLASCDLKCDANSQLTLFYDFFKNVLPFGIREVTIRYNGFNTNQENYNVLNW